MEILMIINISNIVDSLALGHLSSDIPNVKVWLSKRDTVFPAFKVIFSPFQNIF